MRTLTILWRRLVDEKGRTCPRCGRTGAQIEKAVKILAGRLRPRGFAVLARSRALNREAFERNPSGSNRIWIAGRPLEHWLGAKAGKSRCCGACGTAPCRTVELGDKSYAAVPARLIVRAGEAAARARAQALSRRPRS